MSTFSRSNAQLSFVSDDFNDGNITSNPSWTGGTNGYSLTSTSPLEGSYSLTNTTPGSISSISTQYGTNTNLGAANYNFTLLYRDNGSSDPSTLNPWEDFTSNSITHWRFYLAANSTNPNTTTGVCLEHSGSALKLTYRNPSGSNSFELASYTISRNTTYTIKVVAKNNGNWELYVDQGTGDATTLRGNQWPNLFLNGSQNIYMIFQSNATSGNAGRFYWDNAGLFAKSLTIAQLTAGLATGDLEEGAINKAIFGFAATASGGSVKLKNVNISNTNSNSSGNFSNVKLYSSVDNDYSTAGDNTLLSGVTVNLYGSYFNITGIEQDIAKGTTKNYFLVTDIATGGGASSIQLSMSCSSCGASNSNVYTENSETVNNFSFTGSNYNFVRVCIWNNTTAVGNFTDDWQTSNAWVNFAGPPTANDILMFSQGGTATPLLIPSGSFKRIVIRNNTTVNITTTGLTNGSRTFTLTGGTGDDLEIEAGSVLNIISTGNTLAIAMNSGNTGSVSGAINFSGKGHTLTAASAGAITFQNGSSFTGGTGLTGNPFGSTTAGSIVFASGATLEDQVGLDYFSSNNVISLQSGSNYKHSTATTPSINNKTFGNLILNTGATFNAATNNHTINGNVTGAGTLNLTSGTLNVSGNFSSTGTFGCTSCTINLNGTAQTLRAGTYATLALSGSGTKTVSGAITVNTALSVASGTSLDMSNYALSGTLTSLTNSGTIITSNTSSTPIPVGKTWGGTVQYATTNGAQTVVNGTYNNLTLSAATGTNTAGGNIVVNGTLSNGAGTFNLSTNTLTGTLSSVSNSGTIITSNISSAPVPTGKNWGGTVQYAVSSGGQTIVNGTYNNLTLSAASGTNTANGNLVVNGTFTNGAGTLDLAANTLTGALSSITNNGTIKTSSTSSTALATGKTWGGTIQYVLTSGGQTIANGTYNNLTLSNTTGSNTANGNVVVNGSLSIAAGTFNLSTYTLSGTLSSITNNGTISTASLSTTPLPSGRTWGGTVKYAGSNAQTAVAGTYNNFDLSNTAGASLDGAITVSNSLVINSGKLSLGNNTLTLNGTVSGMSATRSFTGSDTANIIIGGTGSLGTLYFDQSDTTLTNHINNLTINRTNLSGTVTLGNELRLKGTLTPTAGTLYTNDTLVLTSSANGSAKILTINPANFAIVGKVSVERYFSAKTTRRWSFVSAAVAGETFRNALQDDIFITGSGTGGTLCATDSTKYNSNGFDVSSTNAATVYTYDQSNAARWIALPNTTSTNVEKGKGYRMLIRGNRNVANACSDQISTVNPSAPVATVIKVKGTLTTGNVPVTISAKTTGTYGYTLIGNPYACEVDFSNFYTANSGVISNKYWTYDPGTDNTNYLVYSMGVVAGNRPSNIITSANGNRIASGQAFFVESINGGTATFSESHKTSSTQQGVFRTNTVNKIIRTTFEQQDGTFIDNMVVRFSDDPDVSLAESRDWDAATLNTGNFVAAIKGNRSFAIQSRPLSFYNDTVLVRIVSSATGNFRLNFSEYDNFTEAAQIILLDLYSGTQTDVKASPVYNFSITSNAATQGGRFKLVFRSSTSVMPVSFVGVTATKKEKSVEVRWDLAFEQDVQQYVVERSADGRNFSSIATVASKGNSNVPVNYSLIDVKPLGGSSYYRIRSVEKDGTQKLSSIVQVDIKNAGEIKVYPNPAKDVLNIQLSSANSNLVIRNSFGATVLQQKLGASGNIINVSALAAGMYYFTVVEIDGTVYTGKFLKQ